MTHVSTSRRGFTLMELLIAVAIVGLLATVIAVGVDTARAKSRDGRRTADLHLVQRGLEYAFVQGSGYPPTDATGYPLGDAAHKVLCGQGQGSIFAGDESTCDTGRVYMSLVPREPLPSLDYIYQLPAGSTSGSAYCIQSVLERGVASAGLEAGPFYLDHDGFKNGTCP